MYFDVKQAEYISDYKIKLIFTDNCTGVVDLSDYPNPNNVFKKFLNKEYFQNFKVEYGTLIWGDGELDIAPEHLYQIATGITIEWTIQQNAV